MELVYRLAVDESPYIQKIRSRIVTLITPIVEVDGRDRHVDIYRWHLANPGKNWPSTLYWGKYVAHDNNRDAMALTLNLTRNVLNTYVGWKAQVLHDLHESVAYLYDNTVGDGPYNAWLDPILTDEWQMIGWNNVSEMTKFGMPGVFTHGTFDTWTPGYLMFIAATHNGISRLYETFGNGGADTLERTLGADRDCPHLVQAESPAAESEVVAAKQQQLSGDGPARFAESLRRQQEPVPEELLPEEQAVDPEAEGGGTCRLCLSWRRSPHRAAGGVVEDPAAAGVRDLQSDCPFHRYRCRAGADPRVHSTNDSASAGRSGPERGRTAGTGSAVAGKASGTRPRA